jgi:hypothetical protein
MKHNKGRQKEQHFLITAKLSPYSEKKVLTFCHHSDDQYYLPDSREMVQLRKWYSLRGFPPVIILHASILKYSCLFSLTRQTENAWITEK